MHAPRHLTVKKKEFTGSAVSGFEPWQAWQHEEEVVMLQFKLRVFFQSQSKGGGALMLASNVCGI